MMKRISLLLSLLLVTLTGARANDGVFYAQGNQLIPITETEISVRKEILTINRIGKTDVVEISVYYEFFNPTNRTKTLLVGFEAAAPYPYEGLDHFPEQPNIHDFRVIMNGQSLPFQVAHVEGDKFSYDASEHPVPPYYVNGKVLDWTKKQCEDAIVEAEEFYYPFDYVYHFNASFQPGVNTVEHTYRFLMSESVDMKHILPYVLTAACRWANHQIDDFTLRINMGDGESFAIYPHFFQSAAEWTINGVGKTDITPFGGEDSPRFHIREGGISFHKTNFRPEGELLLFQERGFLTYYYSYENEPLSSASIVSSIGDYYYDWSSLLEEKIQSTPADARILRNLPFAYRGYVFKSKDLQKFFESTAWYIPNPNYVADMDAMSQKEKEWINFWMKRQ